MSSHIFSTRDSIWAGVPQPPSLPFLIRDSSLTFHSPKPAHAPFAPYPRPVRAIRCASSRELASPC